MRTKKCPYTLNQHHKLGAALQKMRDELLTISTSLGEAYTKRLSEK